jgi:hypothetical protein
MNKQIIPTPEPTLEQVLGAEVVQNIKDYVNSITEENLTKAYLVLLFRLQHRDYAYLDGCFYGDKPEEELSGLKSEVDRLKFTVQCVQERFPYLKGTYRVLRVRAGRQAECIESDDPTFKRIWGDFIP